MHLLRLVLRLLHVRRGRAVRREGRRHGLEHDAAQEALTQRERIVFFAECGRLRANALVMLLERSDALLEFHHVLFLACTELLSGIARARLPSAER